MCHLISEYYPETPMSLVPRGGKYLQTHVDWGTKGRIPLVIKGGQNGSEQRGGTEVNMKIQCLLFECHKGAEAMIILQMHHGGSGLEVPLWFFGDGGGINSSHWTETLHFCSALYHSSNDLL
jgi:hypothetical protein